MDLGVGTFEPVEIEPEKRKRRSGSLLGGGDSSDGPGGGRRGGGGGDGGDGPSDFGKLKNDADPLDKSRILTGFLLIVVLMTFGGLIGAYVFVATNKALEWRPFDLPVQVWISTLIIAVSSITYEFGKKAINNGDIPRIRRWMVSTAVLGGVFISSQLLLWLILVNRGYYMRGNPYAGFFYVLTAAHAIHVIGGIIALGAVLLRSWIPASSSTEASYRINLARSVGWYWHFMGGLWIILFLLLAFWK